MNALRRLNPFRSESWNSGSDVDALGNPLSGWFGEQAPPIGGLKRRQPAISNWAPPVDVIEEDDRFIVNAEIPDIDMKHVRVTVEHGELRISGERRFVRENSGRKYHRIERSYGSFIRTFAMPEGVNGANVYAEFKDGLLSVHLPKDDIASLGPSRPG